MAPRNVINGPMEVADDPCDGTGGLIGGGRWVHEIGQVVPWEVADGSMKWNRWPHEKGQMVPWKVMIQSPMGDDK